MYKGFPLKKNIVISLARTLTNLARTVVSLGRAMTSLARTVASPARTVRKPFPTKSLPLPPGPNSASTRRARSASLMGWVGWGWTGYQKCPSISFILCGYIDKVLPTCLLIR